MATKRKKRRGSRKKASVKRRIIRHRRNPGKRRKYRRNPAGLKSLKGAFGKKHVISIVSLGVGFVGGIKAQKFINGMDFFVKYRRFTGIIPFVLGALVTIKSRKEAVKSVGAGLSLSGLYDIVTQNVPQIGLTPVEGVDLDDESYDGTAIDIDGNTIEMEGDNETVIVGDDTELVGDAYDSPYAMV